jgi:bifunctional non-homologous end joining protein LigD
MRHPAFNKITAAQSRRLDSQASIAVIPKTQDRVDLQLDGRLVHLTNLRKVFWPASGLTKGDLLRYYLEVSGVLLPHLLDRAMVMKRYPNGAGSDFFFMKRAPKTRPDWLQVCKIKHASGNVIDFPVIQDLASLLWVVNLGCIDLNPWYARCDDVHRPDYLHFDLDPVKGTSLKKVLETALRLHEALESLKIASLVKTTGSRGLHVYVPIVRGPTQKEVWTFSKAFAQSLASRYPRLITIEYRVEKRPAGHVLVDYNQNAWGRTLASIYSVRPRPQAPVSMPVRWKEVRKGFRLEDFRIDNAPTRIRRLGDLWKPLLSNRGRVRLERFL